MAFVSDLIELSCHMNTDAWARLSDSTHHSVESFMVIVNRENRVSEMMREYVEYYEDGEAFHSFSGPVVDYKDYL